MPRPLFYSLFILIIAAMLLLTAFQKQTRAQSMVFNSVIPVSTTGGMMGFFDQKDGTLYLYDQTLTDCIQIVQLKELGKPLNKIKQ